MAFNPYAPPKLDQAPLPEYDAIRRRLGNQLTTQKQEDEDAIKRRFAQAGMVGSGSYIKQAAIGDEQHNQQAIDAQEQVNAQEAQEKQRRNEVANQMAYGTSEREAGQQFSAGEAQKQRLFQQKNIDNDAAFRQQMFKYQQQMDTIHNNFQGLEYNEDVRTNRFNEITNPAFQGMNNDDIKALTDRANSIFGGNYVSIGKNGQLVFGGGSTPGGASGPGAGGAPQMAVQPAGAAATPSGGYEGSRATQIKSLQTAYEDYKKISPNGAYAMDPKLQQIQAAMGDLQSGKITQEQLGYYYPQLATELRAKGYHI